MDKYKKNIAKVTWPDDSELSASDGIELKMINEFHGDHDDDWIIEIKNGQEISRHNVKFISDIEWQNKPEICPHCGGSGEGKSMIVCPVCKGSGKVLKPGETG